MLTAKDLMIGDYVIRKNVPKEILIVVAIDSIRGIVYLDLDGLGITEKIENIEPIPLTTDILEKNGFVKSYGVSDTPPYDIDEEGNMYYSFKGEHKFWGWWQPDNTYYIPANAMGDIVIKYLHELQHALRLAGIKKTIEL